MNGLKIAFKKKLRQNIFYCIVLFLNCEKSVVLQHVNWSVVIMSSKINPKRFTYTVSKITDNLIKPYRKKLYNF